MLFYLKSDIRTPIGIEPRHPAPPNRIQDRNSGLTPTVRSIISPFVCRTLCVDSIACCSERSTLQYQTMIVLVGD
jgi:hypothetical protein